MLGSKHAGVARVMSLGRPSRVHPTASLAANLAMGKPVALDASAEERDTRGFISITTSSPSSGLMLNCTLDPPQSTPISRMMAMAASRRRWYSRSVRVCAGATVMESPVCTPMGSMFSMLHTMTTLSLRSRITSSSYSFHPSRDCSTSTCEVMDAARPEATMARNSSMLYAMPPPVPPSVKAGRMITGKRFWSTVAWILRASSRVSAVSEAAILRPMRSMACLNSRRSSATLMASRSAPMSSMPSSSSTPRSARALARLRAVCPPMVGSTASGRSRSRMARTSSGVMGPTYVASAVSGSVMMVAGLLFTSTTSYPSSRSALQACVPE
mmetsp:Transcript_32869/g.92035  ORF Transcript_32869/g.92035 Transcript_32869/m.92035 type:complete len:327 (-) Transcript_32869:74-1054(-)